MSGNLSRPSESFPAMRTRLRDGIRALFPNCPDYFVDSFFGLAASSTDALVGRANLVLPKPYGRNHILCCDGAFGISFAWMLPGQTTSLHMHVRRKEWFLVRCGQLTLRTPSTETVLGSGDHGCSMPYQPHALTNRGDDILEFMEIFGPPLLDDKFRISDSYNRATGLVGKFE